MPDGTQKIQEHGFPQFGGSDEPPEKPIFTEKDVWGEGTRGESARPLNVSDEHVGAGPPKCRNMFDDDGSPKCFDNMFNFCVRPYPSGASRARRPPPSDPFGPVPTAEAGELGEMAASERPL